LQFRNGLSKNIFLEPLSSPLSAYMLHPCRFKLIMNKFKAPLDIIDINPYVAVPEEVLAELFRQFGKDKGPIPVRGEVNKLAYTQSLVKFRGAWRLYINTLMLKDSPKRIGEVLHISIEIDPEDRTLAIHPKLEAALKKNSTAQNVFEQLPPSRKKEINRYLHQLKTEVSVDKNVKRALQFLLGKERFIGRDTPL
jgi:hypothetical protein